MLVNTRYVTAPKNWKLHAWRRIQSMTTQHTNWVSACIKPFCTTSTTNLPRFPTNYKTCHILWQTMCMMYFQNGFLRWLIYTRAQMLVHIIILLACSLSNTAFLIHTTLLSRCLWIQCCKRFGNTTKIMHITIIH